MTLGHDIDLVTDRLAEGLSGMGHDVTVYCNLHDETYIDRRYKTEALILPVARSASEYETRAEKAVRPFLDEEDLWIVGTFPFFKASSDFGRPWIAVDHGVVPSELSPKSSRAYLDYIRRTQYGEYLQKASKIVCVSLFLREKLPVALRRRSVVIHLGGDYSASNYLLDLKKELGLKGVVVLYQGRSRDTNPYKGIDVLLTTCSKLPRERSNVSLLISTSCSLQEQDRLRRAGAVVLNGVQMPFLSSVYRCGDIFATATQWEGFDLPLLEASYLGLPVVAFDIGAHRETVEDGKTGYLVKTQADFLDRLNRLVRDDELRRKMGKEGAAFAAEFKWSRTVEAFGQLAAETVES